MASLSETLPLEECKTLLLVLCLQRRLSIDSAIKILYALRDGERLCIFKHDRWAITAGEKYMDKFHIKLDNLDWCK